MSEEEKKEEQKEEEQKKEFSFVKEKFKDELPSGKRLLHKSIKLAGCGVIFGLAASLAFYALKPFIEGRFGAPPSEVSIPEDEKEQEKQEEQKAEDQEPATLTIDNYKELNSILLPVVNTASKSIVEVRGQLGDEEWSDTKFDEANSATGIFMADNGQEVLILTHGQVLKDAREIQVIFADNQMYKANVKAQDANLGLAVISIAKASISESTWKQIEPATLGNSNMVARGDAIIALGKPHGFAGGMGYGVISATKYHMETADGRCEILNTDMAASAQGTGILINLNGEVVGIIDPNISSGDNNNLITAYAVSDIKVQVNSLLNGKRVPFVGIWGVDITEEVAEREKLPKGIYVKEVVADSPAMAAGIKTGDIITEVAQIDILTVAGYQRKLLEQQVGDSIRIAGKRLGNEGYVDIQFDIIIGSKE